MEILEKLPPSFKKDGDCYGGEMASGIVDGEAAVVVNGENEKERA